MTQATTHFRHPRRLGGTSQISDAKDDRRLLRFCYVSPDDPRPFSEIKTDLVDTWGEDMAIRCLKAIFRVRKARAIRDLQPRRFRCHRPVTRTARPIGVRTRSSRRARPTALGDPDPEPERSRRAPCSSTGGAS